jgi:hypothetical protein
MAPSKTCERLPCPEFAWLKLFCKLGLIKWVLQHGIDELLGRLSRVHTEENSEFVDVLGFFVCTIVASEKWNGLCDASKEDFGDPKQEKLLLEKVLRSDWVDWKFVDQVSKILETEFEGFCAFLDE